MRLTEKNWVAIKNNDKSFDNQFWYGVKTTKIFCRPSCPSRLPKKENVEIFASSEAAQAAGFRPCKRCRPLNRPVSNQVWIEEINHVLVEHYPENITLAELAYRVHGSESYLRHVYRELTGLTPQQKLAKIRLEKAKSYLQETDESVGIIAGRVGIPNSAYFIKCFAETYGQTPYQYRLQHA